jgi:hypothetical protein
VDIAYNEPELSACSFGPKVEHLVTLWEKYRKDSLVYESASRYLEVFITS